MQPETDNIVLTYLETMDQQREQLFAALEDLSEDALWQPPGEKEWSIGENLDHLRVINSNNLTLYKITWILLFSLAKLRYDKPYDVDIDNVYKRSGFPLSKCWIWSAKFTPEKPTSVDVLKVNLTNTYQAVRIFYTGKDPDYLGHVSMYDPATGWLNLIQALRVGLYHDELHINQIQEVRQKLGNQDSVKPE
jgi:hypothetical protein